MYQFCQAKHPGMRSEWHRQTPMDEIPLIYVFRVWDLEFWDWGKIFCIGVFGNGILSLAFCTEIKHPCKKKQSIKLVNSTGGSYLK